MTYATSVSDGSPLPSWISFDPKNITYEGTPWYTDMPFLGSKTLSIALNATDEKLTTSTIWQISMTGDTIGTMLIKVLGPLFTGLTVAMTLYSRRDLFLNPINRMFYKRRHQPGFVFGLFMPMWQKYCIYYETRIIIVIGQSQIVKTLDVPPKYIARVEAVHKREGIPWYKFWKETYKSIPGGILLPHWLMYNEHTNTLQVKRCSSGPPATEKSFTILVKDRFNVILEEILVNFTDTDLVVTWHKGDATPPTADFVGSDPYSHRRRSSVYSATVWKDDEDSTKPPSRTGPSNAPPSLSRSLSPTPSNSPMFVVDPVTKP